MVKESDIVHENGDFWVCKDKNAYTVMLPKVTHSVSDSSYKKDSSGLSIAKARCDYLVRRTLDSLKRGAK